MYTTQGEFVETFAAPAPAGCPVCPVCSVVPTAPAARPPTVPAPAPTSALNAFAAMFAPAPAARPPTVPIVAAPAARPPTVVAPPTAPAAPIVAPIVAPPIVIAPTNVAPISQQQMVDEEAITMQNGAFYAFRTLYPTLSASDKLKLRQNFYMVIKQMPSNAPKIALLQNAVNAAMAIGAAKVQSFIMVDESDIKTPAGEFFRFSIAYDYNIDKNTLRQICWLVKMANFTSPSEQLAEIVMNMYSPLSQIPSVPEGELMNSPQWQVFTKSFNQFVPPFYSKLSAQDKIIFRQLCFSARNRNPPQMMLKTIRATSLLMFGPLANLIPQV